MGKIDRSIMSSRTIIRDNNPLRLWRTRNQVGAVDGVLHRVDDRGSNSRLSTDSILDRELSVVQAHKVAIELRIVHILLRPAVSDKSKCLLCDLPRRGRWAEPCDRDIAGCVDAGDSCPGGQTAAVIEVYQIEKGDLRVLIVDSDLHERVSMQGKFK